MKACYEAKANEAGLFGTLGAHLAMVRLAERFGDAAAGRSAWLQLSNQLRRGLTFDGDPEIGTDEARMSEMEQSTLRLYGVNNNGGLYWHKQDGSIYRGMMFYSMAPAIGRYLAEHVREAVLRRHAAGVRRFPFWWMLDAPYFQRDYTGDEGIGLVQPEMMGMMFPVERWVVGAAPSALAGYMASAPSCRGDCVWIESLVQTIEAHGITLWRDVRFQP
jgi:hypothetical protein